MFGRVALAIAWWLIAVTPIHADEESDRARQFARDVRSRPVSEAASLAKAEGAPDPWLVVDALLEAKEPDAAKTFAATIVRPGAAALQAYAARPPREPSSARSTLAEAEAKLAEPVDDVVGRNANAESAVKLLDASDDLAPGVLKVRWLTARARARWSTGFFRDAARDYRAASETAERLSWIHRAALLASRSGYASYRDDDSRGALASFTRSTTLLRGLGAGRMEVEALETLAELHLRFGETGFADDCLARAESIMASDPDAELRATVAAMRGITHARMGNFETGRREIRAAIDELARHPPSLVLGDAWIALGQIRRELGDRIGAREAFDRARDVFAGTAESPEWKPNSRAIGLGMAAANAAVVLAEEGRFDEAHAAFDTQRKEFVAGEDPASAAQALQSMAEVRLRQIADAGPGPKRTQWLEEALADARAAAAQSEAAHDPEARIGALGNLGTAEELRGHVDEAKRLYEDVVREATEMGSSSLVLEYSIKLARIRVASEDYTGALKAVELGIGCLDRTFEPFGDQTRIQVRSGHAELFELGVRAALSRSDRAGLEKLFRFAEMGRASGLLDALENRDAIRGKGVRPELERARIEAARSVFETKLAMDAAHGDLEAGRAARLRFNDARSAYERAIDAIQTDSRVSANLLYPQPITLTDAQSGLRRSEALIVYQRSRDRAHAIVITRADAKLVELGKDETVTEACREALVRGARPDAAAVWDAAAAAAWHPVARVLPDDITDVSISPDGDLGLLPFPALPPLPRAPTATGVARVVERSWTFVPSASTMFVLRDTADRRGIGVLALAISKYRDLAPAAGAPGRVRSGLVDLEAAEDEAIALSDPKAGDVRLLGRHATEDEFLAALSKHGPWRAIHFAVHGCPNEINPTLSFLALAPSETNDGDLTSFELLQQHIAADVAVLAACDSGGGTPVPGEGLVGLVRAFMFAGCPRIVASLWNADDAAAKQFSLAFHAAWRTGTATFEQCLEAGRAEVRKNPRWTHPHFWAGWCGWGASRISVDAPPRTPK